LISNQAEFCGQKIILSHHKYHLLYPELQSPIETSHYNTILFECAKTSTVHTMLGVKVSMAIRVEKVAKPSKIQWDGTKLR
jgi:hypothetical protein